MFKSLKGSLGSDVIGLHTMSSLNKLLLENSTRHFFIEWGGYRSNHMSHGLVALHRLGASTDYLERFAKRYSQSTLKPAQSHPSEFRLSGDGDLSVDALLGKRGKYYVVLDHYEGMLKDRYSGDYQAMIKGEFPLLSSGMVGSALHGLIHTGYGLVAQCSWSVVEGLAYLHQSYLPIQLSTAAPSWQTIGQGNKDILDVLKQVKEDNKMTQQMFVDMQREDAICKTRGNFQPRVGALLHHQGDTLANYAHQVQFPAFYDPSSRQFDQLKAVLDWIVNCAITVYVAAERRNDFFLLHGITSAWCLKQILTLIQDYDIGLESVRTYLCVLLAVYTAQEKPALCLEHLPKDGVDQPSWTDIVDRTLAEHRDEHLYKVVQVCRDMDKETDDVNMTKLYKAAALIAVTEEIAFL